MDQKDSIYQLLNASHALARPVMKPRHLTQTKVSDKEYRVDTTIVLGVVCDLCVTTPDDLASGSCQPQLRYVDFEDGTLAQNTKLCIEGVLRVLLDGNDRQLNRDGKLGMGHWWVVSFMCFLLQQ